MTSPIPAVAYLRVSTDTQAESGLGLEAQRASIEALAASKGLHIAAWKADEGVSGSADVSKRPGLLEALGLLHQGWVLVVAKRDRLSREEFLSAWINKEVVKRGARIVSCAPEGDDLTPTGQLLRRIIEAFAAYERQIIVSRVKGGLKAKIARKELCGGLLYGYDVRFEQISAKKRIGHLIPNDHEQAVIRAMLTRREHGLSYGAIARSLDADGTPPRNGGKWSKKVVQGIVVRVLARTVPPCHSPSP